MEISERILNTANKLFMRYGIKSVTMDDIAMELGISKKTIYQHYPDKDEIVYQVVLQEMCNDKADLEDLGRLSENMIDKMIKTSEMMRVQLSTMNPLVLFDVRKYHPRAWGVFQEHKKNFILKYMLQDLHQGVEEGVFRNDINLEILARMRMEQIEMGFDMQIFPPDRFNLVEVQLTFVEHFLQGILTEKGRKLYQQYRSKILQTSTVRQ